MSQASRGKSKTISRAQAIAQDVKVSVMINCVLYFLSRVYVLKEAGKYRLRVIHSDRVLVDNTYKTVKGAKIAFTKLYKPWKEHIKPLWGPFYNPDMDWLQEMSAITTTNH